MASFRHPAMAAAAGAVLSLGISGTALAVPAPATPVPVACDTAALVNAIGFATAGSTLSLARGCTYYLTDGIKVGTIITIAGNGATMTPGVADPDFSMLNLNPSANLQISDLNLSDGQDADGNGAAAFVTGGTLSLVNCTLDGNFSQQGGAIGGNGATLMVDRSKFTGNVSAQDGGAIEAFNDSTVTVRDSSFFNNTAQGPAPRRSGGGGAISTLLSSSLSVTGSVFSGNTAVGGGALFADQGSLTVSGSTFASNTATAGDGGAILATSAAGTYSGVTVKQNTAAQDGGGISVDTNSAIGFAAIDANTSGGSGGGIYSTAPALTVTGTLVWRNSAVAGGGIFFTGALNLTASLVGGNKPNNCVPTVTGC
jgi:predicted outer membrane repeat protein